jgi:hypothetical protein
MKKDFQDAFIAFVNDSDAICGYIGWTGHGRAIYKDKEKKILWIIDSWKSKLTTTSQAWKIMEKIVKVALFTPTGYSIKLWEREPEQGAEGSCVAFAILRSIMIARLGPEKGINMRYEGGKNPEFLDYVMLTYRLISIFIPSKKKRTKDRFVIE